MNNEEFIKRLHKLEEEHFDRTLMPSRLVAAPDIIRDHSGVFTCGYDGRYMFKGRYIEVDPNMAPGEVRFETVKQ